MVNCLIYFVFRILIVFGTRIKELGSSKLGDGFCRKLDF